MMSQLETLQPAPSSLLPIGKLVDAYGLNNQDIEILAKAAQCQVPDSIMRRYHGALDQRAGRIVELNPNAPTGVMAIEQLVVFFRSWAQECAEKDFQKNPGPYAGHGGYGVIKINDIYHDCIWPKSVEYMKEYLSIFHELSNKSCGRSPLTGWDRIIQNLAVKMDINSNVANNYLVEELKRATLECCLVEKAEAAAFLINNDYIFKQEVNGYSREFHNALVQKLASRGHTNENPKPGEPPLEASSAETSLAGQEQIEPHPVSEGAPEAPYAERQKKYKDLKYSKNIKKENPEIMRYIEEMREIQKKTDGDIARELFKEGAINAVIGGLMRDPENKPSAEQAGKRLKKNP